MTIITQQSESLSIIKSMLASLPCPAILLSKDYRILATNTHYDSEFGDIDFSSPQFCYQISHGYDVPCDQAGEDCPLQAALNSKHQERVLHIHQTPRGKEHIDVELTPLFNENDELMYFIEQFKPVKIASTKANTQNMVGESKAFNQMIEKITRVSRSDASVLLLGESGTGKELSAKAIHEASNRKDSSLVTLECAGLSDALFESELFGHVKGAFTGANNNKKGLVELADGGTLFLDEIGDVPLSMQVKLLRLIETGTFRQVGSAQVKHSDFRLVCATHKNLYDMVKDQTFREDLYYRINVFPIHVPSLSERQKDIPLIANTLLHNLSKNKDYHFTQSATDALLNHHYAGNIRELRNILNRAIILADSNLIDGRIIQSAIEFDKASYSNKNSIIQGDLHKEENWVDLKTAELDYLQRLMSAHNNDKEVVAKIAGISLRSLYRKLEY